MSQDKRFSDEFLNAFVDNELTHEDKADAYIHINADSELSQRVCELRKVHDLVQLGYKNPPAAPQSSSARPESKPLWRNIAAGVTLLLGAALGWQLTDPNNPAPEQQVQQQLAEEVATTALTANPEAQMKVLFHLNSGDTAHIKEALDEVENLLQYYRKTQQAGRIELVTNGEGINLLRLDTSPFVERVQRMQKEYDNLSFVACQNSLDILTGDNSSMTMLIPGTVVIDSGVAQIMRRQQQGWAYIQV